MLCVLRCGKSKANKRCVDKILPGDVLEDGMAANLVGTRPFVGAASEQPREDLDLENAEEKSALRPKTGERKKKEGERETDAKPRF